MINICSLKEYKKTKEKCVKICFNKKIVIKNRIEKIYFYYRYNCKIITTTNKLKYIHMGNDAIDLSNSIKNILISNCKNEISKKIIKIMTKCFNKIITNNINYLYIYNCKKIKNINDVSRLKTINTLRIICCNNIKDVSGLGTVNTLEIYQCNNIKNISELGTVNKLIINNCNNITDVSKLGTVNILTIAYCNNITNVSKLGTVNTLTLYYCNNITDIGGLENVNILIIKYCYGIKYMSYFILICKHLLKKMNNINKKIEIDFL